MPFAEIVGQDRAVGSLRAALRRGALHHAYLFGGPEGVGKATVARLLAQAANCERAGDDPCGACGPCRKIARGVHPDVIAVAEERVMVKAGRWEPRGGRSPSKDIVVDQIRDLVDHRIAMARVEGRRRVVILDPADAMNVAAQNALLKTLEEPPDGTTLVLVASAPDALLPTIRSRCLRLPFAPLPDALLAERLEAAGRDAASARLASALAAGSLGRALALDEKALDGVRDAVRAAAALGPEDARAWLAFAAEHGKEREGARELCELLQIWIRDVVAWQAAEEGAPIALGDLAEETRAAAGRLSPAQVLRRGEAVTACLAALRGNAVGTLALERMLVDWFVPQAGTGHGRSAA